MNPISLLRRYVRSRTAKLCLLQVFVLLRTFLGGAGFMLIIPAINALAVPIESSDPKFTILLSLIPGTDSLSGILVMFLIVMFAMAAITYYIAVLQEQIEQGVVASLRKDIYRLTLGAQWQFVAGVHRADYVRIQTDEVDAIASLLSYLMQLTTLIATILVYTLLSLYLSPSVTIAAILVSIGMIILMYPIQRRLVVSGAKHLSSSEKLYRKTNEQITGIRAIKSSTTISGQQHAFNQVVENLHGEEQRYTNLSALTAVLNTAIAALTFCLLAWLATAWFETDSAVLLVIALIFARLMPQFAQLQTVTQRIAFLWPSLKDVTKYIVNIELHQEIQHDQTPIDAQAFAQGLSLRDVGFRYPGSEKDVLKRLTADIPANSLTLITGNSGIGKSTLADIVSGLSLPTTGSVMAGSTPLNEQNCQNWRHHVTYVPQTPFLIDASIRENLCLLTDQSPDDEALSLVLRQASASFVLALPDGLNTRIGEDGNRLSRGEQQRLLLARALIENTPIMILDESTSNLDATAEAEFLETLIELKRTRSIIMISHKRYLEEFADQILVIDESAGEDHAAT